MKDPLRILIVEDSAVDADLILDEVRRAGYDPDWQRVETEADFIESLDCDFDLILSDYRMPKFCGLQALEILRLRNSTVPLILISGTIGDDIAVAAIQRGAVDYLFKDRLGRLGTAIRRALEQSRSRREQHWAETALRESEERFRQLAENIREVFWITDLSKDLMLYVSPAYETIWGRPIPHLLESPRSWMDAIHPEDYHRVSEAATRQAEGKYDEEYRIVRPDGEIRWIHDRAFPVTNADGKVDRVVGVAGDITERKRAEEFIRSSERRFVSFMDNLPGFAWIKDATGRYTYANKGFGGLALRDPQWIGKTDDQIWPPEIAATYRASDEKVIATRAPLQIIETVLQNGEERVALNSKFPIFDDQGEVAFVCGIGVDVTEHKRLEAQLLRSQRLESIGTLAGGIAHDLNNGLGPIITALDLLRMRFTDSESGELIEILSASAMHCAGMVRQVLSFARGVESRKAEVQVKHLIREIEKIVNDTFLKHIAVRSFVPHDLWTVIGDPTQFHQVLLNLCVNARDAMPAGGVLTLSAENVYLDAQYAVSNPDAHPGAHVCVQIEDSGMGMSSKVLEKIFDPFFTTKQVGKGTGLGLSTSLAIIKNHGGFIRVHSEVGKGSKFQLYIPAQGEKSFPAAAELRDEMPLGNGELILVVDDEAAVRQVTQQTLEVFGYRVVVACDGVEAVRVFAGMSSEIAVVLIDLTMPTMDGLTAIRILRQIKPDVRIIAASGLSANEGADDAKSTVRHFLPKPYTAENLLKVVKQVLVKA